MQNPCGSITSTLFTLSRVPQRIHLGKGHRLEVAPLRLRPGLDRPEPPGEFRRGSLKCALGVHLQVARVVGDGEQQVAKLLLHVVGVCRVLALALRNGFAKFAKLLLDLVDHAGGVLPVEAHARGFFGRALRLEKRGQ